MGKYEEILKSWLKYIEIENVENSKVDTSKIDTRLCIKLSNIENHNNGIIFSIEEITINKLMKQFPILKNDQGEDLNKLFLFIFPIAIHADNKEFFVPLFAFDITSFKESLYDPQKPNTISLNVYEGSNYFIMADVFRKHLGINKEEYFMENIPLVGLIDKIIGKKHNDFKEAFNSLKKYCENNLLNGKLLKEYDAFIYGLIPNDFNKGLKEDISLILETGLRDNDLSKIYIDKNIPEPENDKETDDNETLWYGSFDKKYPISFGQASVLQAVERNDRLIGVQGAPGTGKTTLFLSIIANRVTKRALDLIERKKDFNNQIIIVSTTNKAVDNVIERLLDDDLIKNKNWFYFNGGSKNKIKKEIGRVEAFISELEEEDYSPSKFLTLSDEIKNIKKRLDEIKSWINNCLTVKDEMLSKYKSVENDFIREKKNKIEDEIRELEHYITEAIYVNNDDILNSLIYEIDNAKKYLDELNTIHNLFPNSKADEITINDVCYLIDEVEKTIKRVNSVPFWKLEFIFKARNREYMNFVETNKTLLEDCGIDTKDKHYVDLNFIKDRLDGFKKLVEKLKDIDANITIMNNLKEWEDIAKKLKSLYAQHNQIRKDQETIFKVNSILKKYDMNFNDVNFVDLYRKETVSLNRKLFELSMDFLKQNMLKHKEDLIAALKYWIDLLNGDWSVITDIRDRFKEIYKFWEMVSLAYPVWASTILSYKNFVGSFFYKNNRNGNIYNEIVNKKPINMVLADESGMCTVHTLFPLLHFSDNAVIVGDPKQLEPIVPVPDTTARVFEEENYKDIQTAKKYSPISVSAFHRASGCIDGHYDRVGDSIVLDEHRRCQRDIAELFMSVAKYKKTIKIMTPTLSGARLENLKNMGNKNILFFNVEGSKGNKKNTNIDEIKMIGEVLNKLEQSGYNIRKDVGIITPFNTQEHEIIKEYSSRIGHSKDNIKIGTVHKFQGVEFEVIIFSPVIFSESCSSSFINSKPNMINVAISRAKDLFIVCGNYKKLYNSGSYLRKICEKAYVIKE